MSHHTCAECGRYGINGYEWVWHKDGLTGRWRCADRRACFVRTLDTADSKSAQSEHVKE